MPFMMIDFYLADNRNVLIASVPLSYNSLWEVIATATEIYVKNVSAQNIEDETVRQIEHMKYYTDLKKKIYDNKLLIYSAPVQYIGSLFKEPNIYKAYALASLIASISFNIPDKYYAEVKKPERFKEFIREEDYDIMIEKTDSVLMYLILAFNLMESGFRCISEEISDNVESVLTASNLPHKDILEAEIRTELLKERLTITSDNSERYRKLVTLGDAIFKYRGIGSTQSIMIGISDLMKYIPIVSFDDMLNENIHYKDHNKIIDIYNSIS